MPGIGLLILRAALGIASVVFAILCFSEQASFWPMFVSGGALIAGLFLIGGFLTPAAAALSGTGAAALKLSWLPLPSSSLFESPVVILFAIAIAAALTLLGPGAYSIDSHLFGRREIIIPQRSKF